MNIVLEDCDEAIRCQLDLLHKDIDLAQSQKTNEGPPTNHRLEDLHTHKTQ